MHTSFSSLNGLETLFLWSNWQVQEFARRVQCFALAPQPSLGGQDMASSHMSRHAIPCKGQPMTFRLSGGKAARSRLKSWEGSATAGRCLTDMEDVGNKMMLLLAFTPNKNLILTVK